METISEIEIPNNLSPAEKVGLGALNERIQEINNSATQPADYREMQINRALKVF